MSIPMALVEIGVNPLNGEPLFAPAVQDDAELFSHCAGGSSALTRRWVDKYSRVFAAHGIQPVILSNGDTNG